MTAPPHHLNNLNHGAAQPPHTTHFLQSIPRNSAPTAKTGHVPETVGHVRRNTQLYALHAPKVECIGKGKARKPYEFGIEASIAVSHTNGLIVGAHSFPGNPYDRNTLAEQLEQTRYLLQDLNVTPMTAVVDLGFSGVDGDIAPVQSIHRCKFKTLTTLQRRWLMRRQVVAPTIGHLKQDHRMDRCWLNGAEDDALHTVLCAAGFNIRWLMRAIARLGLAAALICLRRMPAWVLVLGIPCAIPRIRRRHASVQRTSP